MNYIDLRPEYIDGSFLFMDYKEGQLLRISDTDYYVVTGEVMRSGGYVGLYFKPKIKRIRYE